MLLKLVVVPALYIFSLAHKNGALEITIVNTYVEKHWYYKGQKGRVFQ
jgi:hypothetical protein